MDIVDAARLVGAPVEELLEVEETPAGDLISMIDGTHFLNATTPDAEGKTGLMFAAGPDAPNGQPYSGVFPVYAQPADLVDKKVAHPVNHSDKRVLQPADDTVDKRAKR